MQSPDSSKFNNKDVSGESSIKKSLGFKIAKNLSKISFIKKLYTQQKKEKIKSRSEFGNISAKSYKRIAKKEGKQSEKSESINSYSHFLMDLVALTKAIAAGAVKNVSLHILDIITKTFGKSIESIVGKSLFKVAEQQINTQKDKLQGKANKNPGIASQELQTMHANLKVQAKKEVQKNMQTPLPWGKEVGSAVDDLTALDHNTKNKNAKDEKNDLHASKGKDSKDIPNSQISCRSKKIEPIALKDKGDLSNDFLDTILSEAFRKQIMILGFAIKSTNTRLTDEKDENRTSSKKSFAANLDSDQINKKQQLCTSF